MICRKQGREIPGFPKFIISLFEMLHDGQKQGGTGDPFPFFQGKGRCSCPDFLREIHLIDVNAAAYDHIMDVVRLRAHFRQDAADLFAVRHNIVGPFNAGVNAKLLHSLRRGKSHNKGEHAGLLRLAFRAQQEGKIEIASLRGGPASSPPAAARILAVRHHQRSLRRAFLSRLFGIDIRRTRFREIHQAASRPMTFSPVLKTAFDFIFPHHIRGGLQTVAFVLYRFYLIALRLQLVHHLPYSGAGNAEPAAKLLSRYIFLASVLCIPPAHSFSQQGEYFRFHISVSAPLRFLACLLFSEFITK